MPETPRENTNEPKIRVEPKKLTRTDKLWVLLAILLFALLFTLILVYDFA